MNYPLLNHKPADFNLFLFGLIFQLMKKDAQFNYARLQQIANI